MIPLLPFNVITATNPCCRSFGRKTAKAMVHLLSLDSLSTIRKRKTDDRSHFRNTNLGFGGLLDLVCGLFFGTWIDIWVRSSFCDGVLWYAVRYSCLTTETGCIAHANERYALAKSYLRIGLEASNLLNVLSSCVLELSSDTELMDYKGSFYNDRRAAIT